ncbi:FAD-binding oxidoreductase [Nioella sp.]|uniref:FAD-binding oxidoreductase n=1 Tax=Nioella sp. TaxID=1912091 RepID=UPI003B5182B5
MTQLNPADSAFVARLAANLPEGVLSQAELRYLSEPRGLYHGQAGALARPRSTDDVATLIRHAAAARVPVVPYGGGTGLVGGQVAWDGPAPLVISLERMTATRGLDPLAGTLTVEAGTILADVQARAEEAGKLFPLSLASEGSARIGGLLSTNAGGVNVLRYGNARDLVLGIEAVLPTGEVLHGLKGLRKDNLGYDLRHLLIGAEGTLGIITAACLRLVPRPAEQATALIVVDSPADALRLLDLARDLVGDGLSAFELIARAGLEFLDEVGPEVRQPFADKPDWMCLIDLGLPKGQSAGEALMTLFEAAADSGLVQDGLISRSEAQRQEFWAIRESIPEANKRVGAISSHDISVPIGAIPDFLAQGRQSVAHLGPVRINAFGHLGDGNLHYNVFPPVGDAREDWLDRREEVKGLIHDLVHRMGGSVSAEHGVGRLKVGDLERYGDLASLAAMRAIKAALDPVGIMNPGAVLRAE